MKYSELKEKSVGELNSLLKISRERLRDLRFKVASKQLKNIRKIREEKKLIARILTLFKEKPQEINKDKSPQSGVSSAEKVRSDSKEKSKEKK